MYFLTFDNFIHLAFLIILPMFLERKVWMVLGGKVLRKFFCVGFWLLGKNGELAEHLFFLGCPSSLSLCLCLLIIKTRNISFMILSL